MTRAVDLDLPARPRILVITMRRLGDVLLTTALVRSIRRGFPDACLDMLVFRGTDDQQAVWTYRRCRERRIRDDSRLHRCGRDGGRGRVTGGERRGFRAPVCDVSLGNAICHALGHLWIWVGVGDHEQVRFGRHRDR